MPEQIVRPKPTWKLLGVGHTKGEQDFAPRLEKVRLGPRSVGFTLSSIERLIRELAAETPTARMVMPAPNARRAQRRTARGRS